MIIYFYEQGKHLHYEHLYDEDHASYSSLSNLMEDLKAVLQNSSVSEFVTRILL